jgi:hypothetical protein
MALPYSVVRRVRGEDLLAQEAMWVMQNPSTLGR